MYMSFLYRMLKESVKSVGANITPMSVQRISRCLGPLKNTLTSFDSALGIANQPVRHSPAKNEKDRMTIAQELLSQKVFEKMPEQKSRNHKSFSHVKEPLFTNIDNDKITEWLKRVAKHILEFQ